MRYSALFVFNIPNMPAASGNCGKGGRVSKEVDFELGGTKIEPSS